MKFILWPNNPFLRYSLVFSLLLSINTIAISCSSTSSSNESSQGEKISSPNLPVGNTLRVAVNPWQGQEMQAELEPLAEYLETILKRPVSFQITKSYAEALELIVTEEVDMAHIGPFNYIKAKERNPNLQPLVIPIDRVSGRPWYTSVIVANTTKNIQTLEDLKGKRFAFVSPSSTSGFLIPMTGLKAANIDPTRDFSKIRYSGSHYKATQDLADNVVDAVTNDKASFLGTQKSGKLDANYKIIWESKPIPGAPIVINTMKFSPEKIEQLQEAFIDAPVGLVDMSGRESAGYTLTKDADFEEIRQIYNRLKSTTVPEK
ncbi:MAG: phosphate/phosphite/phosphonate ABC transporter substrate-binding protein [Cyanobacteria bacterium P01_H01_bin.35]